MEQPETAEQSPQLLQAERQGQPDLPNERQQQIELIQALVEELTGTPNHRTKLADALQAGIAALEREPELLRQLEQLAIAQDGLSKELAKRRKAEQAARMADANGHMSSRLRDALRE